MSSSAAEATEVAWREFQFVEGSSSKFWKIKLEGDTHTVNYGRIGTSGQAQSKQFDSAAAARKDYDKLIAQKTGKGYAEVGSGAAAASSISTPVTKPAAKKATLKAKDETAETKSTPVAGVASALYLEPRDWFWAQWRDPEPLVRSAPPDFDLDDRLARLRKAKSSYWQVPWDSLIKGPTLSRDEAEFWFTAMTFAADSYNEVHLQIAKGIEKKKFTGKLTMEAAKKMLSVCRAQAEIAQCVGALFSPVEVYDLIVGEWTIKDRYSKKETIDGWAEWLIPGYARDVVPYLSRAERNAAQDHIRKETKKLPLPKGFGEDDYSYAPWMLAGIFGVTDVVERYLDALKGQQPNEYQRNQPPRDVTMPLMGLGSAESFSKHWRAQGLTLNDFHQYGGWGELPTGTLMRAWLAHTEFSGLDLIRDTVTVQTSKESCEALLKQFVNLVVAPQAAPFMLELSQSCKTPQRATQWLNNHVATAIAGLIDVAADKKNSEAIEFLRDKQHEGHSALIEEQLAKLPADRAATVRQTLAGEGEKKFDPHTDQSTPKWLSTALADLAKLKLANADFISLRRLPPIIVDGKKLNDDQVKCVLIALSRPVEAPLQLYELLKEKAERATLDAFVWSIFDQWLSQAAPSKQKWAMQALGHLGGDQVAIKLTPLVRKWPGESQHQRAVAGLECLRAIGSDTALMQLNGIAQKLKFKGLKAKAQEYMEEIAKAKGLTRSQLEDRIVPDCDLNERGSREFDFGPRKFFFTLDSEMKPVVRDEAKKVLKDLPKPNSKDDETKANEAVAEWKLLKAQLREVLKVQVGRLEQSMVTGRRWPVDEFESFMVKHPLMINLARTVVWGAYDAKGKLTGTFRVTEEQDYADTKDNPFTLKGVAQVGIVHPLHLDEGTTKAWGEVFGDYEIATPFPQLGRATFKLEKGEEKQKEITRFNGPKIPATALVGTLERLSWVRGIPQDGGVFYEHTKPFYGANVTAVVQYETGVPVGYMDGWEDQKFTGCFFVPGIYTPHMYPDHKKSMQLKEVDEVVISEVLADLATIAAKGK